jgi:hypothetical protein
MFKQLLAIALLAGPALEAGTMQYSDRDAWIAATGSSFVTVDFAALVDVGDILNVSGGFTQQGIRFEPNGNSQLFIADRDFPGYDFGLPAVLSPQLGFPSGFTAFLPPLTNAISTNLTGFLGDPNDFEILLRTSTGTQTIRLSTAQFPPLGFIGFTSTDPILSVSFSSPAGDQIYGNFSYSQVPEPGTWVLMGGGLALVLWLRRRRAAV